MYGKSLASFLSRAIVVANRVCLQACDCGNLVYPLNIKNSATLRTRRWRGVTATFDIDPSYESSLPTLRRLGHFSRLKLAAFPPNHNRRYHKHRRVRPKDDTGYKIET